MRRKPNPWIALPALGLGVLAGALGWFVTDVSCRQPDGSGGFTTCAGWAALVAVVSFLVVTVGVVTGPGPGLSIYRRMEREKWWV